MNSNVSEIELKRINQRLPELNKLVEEDDAFMKTGFYKKIFISVFDHWLTREEVKNQIFIDENSEELKSRRQKFKDFIEDTYNKTELYTWRYKRHYRFHIQKPTSIKDIFRKCDFENLWSQSGQRYSFILPEYSAVCAEEWDWTNIIWYTNKEKIEPLLEKAKSIGLYILE